MTKEQIAKITKECKRFGTDIICIADVKTEEVEWLAEPLIPIGKVTTIFGDPGLGKTHFCI